ncbi:ribonuclease HII [Clostridium aminobutyricum]|uniref:Ribonuclease HII n=1 Tax=Clostridium aminobutyricum TaxID=33953 RepID=A0A939D6B9_CLOAM|nr:ribonuclease HII [Clostridium aminobutyricum]MBN7771892.1 ribonuclease HII [Clostridium aminobutyricum]
MKKQEREALLVQKLIEMKQYEEALYLQGVKFVAGVDEVGRGPLAGPVVTACVVLPEHFDVLGVDDSKKLSEKKREELYIKIKEKAIVYAIGMADHTTIDEINILEATKKAMKQAIEKVHRELLANHGQGIDHVLIDALTLKDVEIPQTGIIKGDASSISIAAASILAKVTRDRMMVEYAKEYPDYAFERNKGYGTKAHYDGIHKTGVCDIHRRSFLKKITG